MLLTNWQKAQEKEIERKVKEKRKSGRKCQRCGKDPWPNMFWCKGCHPTVKDRRENFPGGIV